MSCYILASFISCLQGFIYIYALLSDWASLWSSHQYSWETVHWLSSNFQSVIPKKWVYYRRFRGWVKYSTEMREASEDVNISCISFVWLYSCCPFKIRTVLTEALLIVAADIRCDQIHCKLLNLCVDVAMKGK